MCNDKGFTLVEVLMALLITMVGLLGLLKAVESATTHNTKAQLRDHAMGVAEESLNRFRAQPFDLVTSSRASSTFPFRGGSGSYQVSMRGTEVATDLKEIRVRVAWAYRNVTSTYEMRSIRRRE